MTENTIGGWHACTWTGVASPTASTGILSLGFVPSTVGAAALTDAATITIEGTTEGTEFTMIDLTETHESTDPDIKYRGGIQSVDKGFTSSPILVPLPYQFQWGTEIGFVDSGVFTIAGVWFDGLAGRDMLLEDIRTTKKVIKEESRGSPLILVLSSRVYPVFITGYSSNIVGGQGNIISFRLGLAITSLDGHYGYSG